jgi:hypothetical protein
MGAFFRVTLLLAFLLSGVRTSFAQSAAPPAAVYEFMTVTTLESASKSASKLFLTPAFQGKTEVQLEDFNAFGAEKNKEKFQVNAQTINQQLSELSVAGWELVQVYPMPTQGVFITRYLFRKAKN